MNITDIWLIPPSMHTSALAINLPSSEAKNSAAARGKERNKASTHGLSLALDGLHVQRFADGIKITARDVMHTAQIGVRCREFPMPVFEYARVGPCAGHFTNEQVMSRLIVRFVDQSAREPRGASCNKRPVMPFDAKQLNAAFRQFSGFGK